MTINARAMSFVATGVSAAGAAAIAIALNITPVHEGRRLQAYADSGGVWTICDGITRGVKMGHVATHEECDKRLAEELSHAAAVIDRKVTVPMPATRRAALIDLVYNVGEGNFSRSTLLKKLNNGDVIGACEQIMRWMYVAGKDCRIRANKCFGIVRRREEQRNMCLMPEPETKPEPPTGQKSASLRPWWRFWG
jgi:lysozyme